MIYGDIFMLKELFEPNTLKPTEEVIVGKCIRISGILHSLMISRYIYIYINHIH